MKTIIPRISKFVACYCQSYCKFSLDLVVGAAVSVGQCRQVFPCTQVAPGCAAPRVLAFLLTCAVDLLLEGICSRRLAHTQK